MKELKRILKITLIAMTLVLLSSCKNESINEGSQINCSNDVSSIAGDYISVDNIYLELSITNDANMSFKDNGVQVSFYDICIQGDYIKATNLEGEIKYIAFSFVRFVDTGEVLGIVLDGDLYMLWQYIKINKEKLAHIFVSNKTNKP